MSDTCQVKRMPLDVFAALGLKPDPLGLVWNSSTDEMTPESAALAAAPRRSAAVRARREALERERLALTASMRTDAPRRAATLRAFWFGPEGRGGAASGGGDPWAVEISPSGIPHSVRSSGGGGGGGGSSIRRSSFSSSGAAELGGGGVVHTKLAARQTHPAAAILRRASLAQGASVGHRGPAWCEAEHSEPEPSQRCPCAFDGLGGPLCEVRHEAFCLNQCSGHGRCDLLGGYCHCERGFFGLDCSMTTDASGRVALHAQHAATLRPRAPSVFVYDLAEHSTLLLQLRGERSYCVHRGFDVANRTSFPDRCAEIAGSS